jgi:hypothetical protein
MNPWASDMVRAEKEVAVRRLLDRYMAALDDLDLAALQGCFTDDADIEHDLRPVRFTGGKEFAEGARILGRFSARDHAISNVVMTVGDNEASVRWRATATLAEQDRIMVRGVRYEDQLVLGGDGWKIRRRRHIPLWQYEVAASALALPDIEDIAQ